jgi:hypothetical protein
MAEISTPFPLVINHFETLSRQPAESEEEEITHDDDDALEQRDRASNCCISAFALHGLFFESAEAHHGRPSTEAIPNP